MINTGETKSVKDCSYFYSAYLERGILTNSGYNCRHPKQEETVTEEGQKVGNCYSWSCPLRIREKAESA
ncbi:hypothetical protein LY28_01320 [Ruminiclostridium sufflavum DSM 19573]|uniref:Uncharacterized protein n=1 Tax=Ruminiclostridium sufflavum DSM 19573 TaxID=1121337 RepID=A0A318XNI2_9FIRM|nr:hypothetical protein [Ruminiclostridium sufflavum]PYG88471.1 hypothetical protein LY28_01320 [Ruminiclostridium sufflavum DSM 19573]